MICRDTRNWTQPTTTTTTVASTDPYVQTGVGNCNADSNYEPIGMSDTFTHDQAALECEAAAIELEISYSSFKVNTASNSNQPQGCFLFVNNNILYYTYNGNPDNSWATRKMICRDTRNWTQPTTTTTTVASTDPYVQTGVGNCNADSNYEPIGMSDTFT